MRDLRSDASAKSCDNEIVSVPPSPPFQRETVQPAARRSESGTVFASVAAPPMRWTASASNMTVVRIVPEPSSCRVMSKRVLTLQPASRPPRTTATKTFRARATDQRFSSAGAGPNPYSGVPEPASSTGGGSTGGTSTA
jgi:hypothetical protein